MIKVFFIFILIFSTFAQVRTGSGGGTVDKKGILGEKFDIYQNIRKKEIATLKIINENYSRCTGHRKTSIKNIMEVYLLILSQKNIKEFEKINGPIIKKCEKVSHEKNCLVDKRLKSSIKALIENKQLFLSYIDEVTLDTSKVYNFFYELVNNEG
ncbi:MAG: hypothetical protein N4A33_08525 [Bacteriovoracaceae bacterium]|jgi:hypothetical protein|nr:hypothetical protein [Bacteriovoracaceae bacterium]